MTQLPDSRVAVGSGNDHRGPVGIQGPPSSGVGIVECDGGEQIGQFDVVVETEVEVLRSLQKPGNRRVRLERAWNRPDEELLRFIELFAGEPFGQQLTDLM